MNDTADFNFLTVERECLDRFLPGLDTELAKLGIKQLERLDNRQAEQPLDRQGGHARETGIQLIKRLGGPGLCIPEKHGGLGANPEQAIRVIRAIGSRAPSAAVATVMHHFSVATLVELMRKSDAMEWLLLEAIAKNNLLVASGFAEGDPEGRILAPNMTLEQTDQGCFISGVKRPCSLSRSMDLICVSFVKSQPRGADQLAVALISADAEGVQARPFWQNRVLSGAETGEVHFDRAVVDSKLISYSGPPNALDRIQTRGLIWFQLLISSAYVGIASALVERILQQSRADDRDVAHFGVTLDAAMTTLSGAARLLEADTATGYALAQSLFARYSVQRSIESATALAFELAGGMDFATSSEASYLIAAARGLSFHPPSRMKTVARLGRFLKGSSLQGV